MIDEKRLLKELVARREYLWDLSNRAHAREQSVLGEIYEGKKEEVEGLISLVIKEMEP